MINHTSNRYYFHLYRGFFNYKNEFYLFDYLKKKSIDANKKNVIIDDTCRLQLISLEDLPNLSCLDMPPVLLSKHCSPTI